MRTRKYADGGIVNVAAPPVGFTDLSASPMQTSQVQSSPYQGFNDQGVQPEGGPVGTGITQPVGNLTAKNRMTGVVGINPQAQNFAKGGMVKKKSSGGMVQVRGYGKARSKPCKIC